MNYAHASSARVEWHIDFCRVGVRIEARCGANAELCLSFVYERDCGLPAAKVVNDCFEREQEPLLETRSGEHLSRRFDKNVEVTLRREDGAITLDVRDDGVGLGEKRQGFGLVGMRERALMLGGAIDTGPDANGGYRFEVDPGTYGVCEVLPANAPAWINTTPKVISGLEIPPASTGNDFGNVCLGSGGGRPPADLSGDVAQRVLQILDSQINPSIASHGGRAELVSVDEGVVYLRLGGGCQGCGMANVTLRQGIEVVERVPIPEDRIPEDAKVEMDAKKAAGYFTDRPPTAEELSLSYTRARSMLISPDGPRQAPLLRKPLTRDEVLENAKTYEAQVSKILDPQKTRVEFNSKWLSALGAEGVVRLAAQYTVARMLERDDFKTRFKEQQPISVHEFLYPLLQGYDSVAVRSDVELGATDQKFNIHMGRELQRSLGQKAGPAGEGQAIFLVPLLVGLFGVAEILSNLEQEMKREVVKARIGGLWPSLADWREARRPIVRGTVLGFFLGILPGGGAVIAAFASYALEKKLSATPERFGNGAIEGVAGPEAANNAAAGGAFIPLMTLGIPPNVVMALLLGAFVIHGLQPGPLLMIQKPELFWGIVASMYIGNVMLLVLNMPLIGIWVQVLKLPYRVMFPLILMFCLVGVFASGAAVFDVFVMVVFGVLGYLMRKFGYEPAPLVLAFVLGPMLENNLRKSLIMSQGDFMLFLERPISAVCLLLAAAALAASLLPALARRRSRLAPVHS